MILLHVNTYLWTERISLYIKHTQEDMPHYLHANISKKQIHHLQLFIIIKEHNTRLVTIIKKYTLIPTDKYKSTCNNEKKIPSRSFPLAAAAIKLALICLRNLFLLSTMSESSPPLNKDTYFSVLGKNCNSNGANFNFR